MPCLSIDANAEADACHNAGAYAFTAIMLAAFSPLMPMLVAFASKPLKLMVIRCWHVALRSAWLGSTLLSAGSDLAFRLFSCIQDQQSKELSQRNVEKRAKKLKIRWVSRMSRSAWLGLSASSEHSSPASPLRPSWRLSVQQCHALHSFPPSARLYYSVWLTGLMGGVAAGRRSLSCHVSLRWITAR